MKKLTTIIGLALVAGIAVCSAQTNSTPGTDTAQNNFISTAGSWLSSIDYTKSWPTNEVDLSVGAAWQNNVNWANYIGVQKNIGNFTLGATMVNGGVFGVIERGQAGAGYRFLNRGDLSAQFTLDAGYARRDANNSVNGKGAFVEPAITLRKIMSHGAFSEISLNYDVFANGQQSQFPGLRIGTGFTF